MWNLYTPTLTMLTLLMVRIFLQIMIECASGYIGPTCNMVGTTRLPFGHAPLMLYNGEVSCQTLTGKISIMRLNSHIFTDDQGITEEEV